MWYYGDFGVPLHRLCTHKYHKTGFSAVGSARRSGR